MVSVRHEETKTQYAYHDAITGGMVSYDDEEGEWKKWRQK